MVLTCFISADVLVEFERGSYEVNEDAGVIAVCVTKDKVTALPVSLLFTAQESTPRSAQCMSNGLLWYQMCNLSNPDSLGEERKFPFI